MLIIGALLASCSHNAKNSGNDTDSAFIENAEAIADSIDNPSNLPELTAEGLGPVRLGMEVDSIPSAWPGLYDRVTADASMDAQTFTFLEGTTPMFMVLDFDGGKANAIELLSPRMSVAGHPGLHIGIPFADVIAMKGVTTEWIPFDDGGQWYWRLDGLYLLPDLERCSAQLGAAMCDSKNPPAASLITADIPLGYLSTGLPF